MGIPVGNSYPFPIFMHWPFFFFFFPRKPRSTWGGSQRGARIQRLPAAPLAVKDVSACANSSSPPITACLGSPANRPAWKCLHVCALKGSWQSQMISHKVPKKDARIAPFFDDLSTTFPYQGCICHSLICRVCIRIIFLLFVFILVQDNTYIYIYLFSSSCKPLHKLDDFSHSLSSSFSSFSASPSQECIVLVSRPPHHPTLTPHADMPASHHSPKIGAAMQDSLYL
ncbi:hypothetical protein QBC42DRAFT_102777 [Cladorrhinum samala]|uniref:Uncharacterized protein n=1 Tax=Cladorrhinum samala TaxID=585594 RepID=A0AAV9HY94_9PEZI|nr:hypothetical protein QBC42DRAFT_102777 [Cladorrhinum samala]